MWQGSEYAWEYNYEKIINIPGFWLCQVSIYVSVAWGFEFAWMWLNNALR